jgi:hypothetical protein
MPDAKTTTTYIQQEQRPGGWADHAKTDDRELALSRYRAFSAGHDRATRLIERTERVLAEGAPAKGGGSRHLAP